MNIAEIYMLIGAILFASIFYCNLNEKQNLISLITGFGVGMMIVGAILSSTL